MLPHRTLIAWLLAGGLTLLSLGIMFLRSHSEDDSLFSLLDPQQLPEAEKKLAEFLLLLPLAATIVCFVRTVIGLSTFGTFAPALLGLAFREVDSPVGLFVLLTILFAGWFLRHAVNYLHLLQVPRTSFMLSLVVLMLVTFVLVASRLNISASHAIPFFPLVILTGMIERFWTVDEEQGTGATFRTLFTTLLVCAVISLMLRLPALTQQMLHYPETLGMVMALQLLMGRYTGYRLMELYRFRALLKDESCSGSSVEKGSGSSAFWG